MNNFNETKENLVKGCQENKKINKRRKKILKEKY